MKKQKISKLSALLSCIFMISVMTGPGIAKAAGVTKIPGIENAKYEKLQLNLKRRMPKEASNYSEVYSFIKQAKESKEDGKHTGMNGGSAPSSAGGSGSSSGSSTSPMPEPNTESGYVTEDYSETNNQVKGVDEGDIVKTDGQYIYIIRNNDLIIMKADGKQTKEISRTALYNDSKKDDKESSYPIEMYVTGTKLAVIMDYYSWSPDSDEPNYPVMMIQDNQMTQVVVYDIEKPESPKKVKTMAQDGWHSSSRLIGDKLYMISQYSVPNEIDKDKPESYIPSTYVDGKSKLVPANCIAICPGFSRIIYNIVTSYDLTKEEIIDNLSMLGSGDTFYMNHKNLYIADSKYEEQASKPEVDGVYSVVKYEGIEVTNITKISIDNGKIDIKAAGNVEGRLLNQFAMDEYEGNLRLVTTVNRQNYKVYEDKAKGWSNYEWLDNPQNNALYVLDEGMNVKGSITDIAKDERVYSVRFSGDVGYFVTFKQVDPLFAVDLSVPENPKIMSALKIPGFSNYMHVYSENRLFGIGMNADEKTGSTKGMKLSMFDVSDPYNVTEKHTLSLTSNYSEALYNHKAILISSERNIIAFPVEDGYEVYGYSDDKGFYKQAEIKDTGKNSYETRGLYIGEYAYICTQEQVTVIDLKNLLAVANIKYSVKPDVTEKGI